MQSKHQRQQQQQQHQTRVAKEAKTLHLTGAREVLVMVHGAPAAAPALIPGEVPRRVASLGPQTAGKGRAAGEVPVRVARVETVGVAVSRETERLMVAGEAA